MPNNTRDIAVFDANGRTVATLTQVKAGNRDTDSVIAYMGYQPNQLHRINDKRIDHLSEYVSTQAHIDLSALVDAQIAALNEVSTSSDTYEVQTYALNFFDDNNNLVAKLANDNWTLYDYDLGTNRLEKEWRISGQHTEFQWDKVGNLLYRGEFNDQKSRRYAYLANNKLQSVGFDDVNNNLASYDYDDYGNLTTVTSYSIPDLPEGNYHYDSLGRMTYYKASNNGNHEVSNYSYDALERRVYSSGYKETAGWVTEKSAWAFASLYDGRQERAMWTPNSRVRNGTWAENENAIIEQEWTQLQPFKQLSYVPNAVGGMYGQLISQDLYAPDLPEFSNLDANVPVDRRGKLYFHQCCSCGHPLTAP